MGNQFTNLDFPDVLLNKLPRAHFHIYFLNVFHNWETHMVSFFPCLLGIETWQLYSGYCNQVCFPGPSYWSHWTAQSSFCLQYEPELYSRWGPQHFISPLPCHPSTECELLWQETCWALELANRDTIFVTNKASIAKVTTIITQDTNNCGWIYLAGRGKGGWFS